MHMPNMAYCEIDLSLLAAMMNLPHGTEIARVTELPDKPGVVAMQVSHPDLPVVAAGRPLQRCNPQYRMFASNNADGCPGVLWMGDRGRKLNITGGRDGEN